jgi:predicted nucleic acid-binding protein
VLIVDTGPLVATADTTDPDHDACVELLETAPGPLLTTGLVIAGAAYLIARQTGPVGEVALYADIIEGRLHVDALTLEDWQRVRELVETYADLGLGGADASIIAIAERHRVREIATLDERHFRVVRPRHRDAFDLVPGAGS